MSMNGIVVVFPTEGTPPDNPDAKARELIDCFERLGLLSAGTAAICKTPQPWIGRFAEVRKRGEILPEDYAIYIVKPERILPAMASLVNLLTPEDIGMEDEEYERPGPFGLPYVEFSVIRKTMPIECAHDGRVMANTWATIEFSYEDVHYDPEFQRILDVKHPLFAELAIAFGSPTSWDVDIG